MSHPNKGNPATIKVLGRLTSSNVQKVLWTLEEIGLEYERSDLGGAFGWLDTDDYRAMDPNGVIPTVIDGDLVLWESNAIVRYLAAKHDDGGLSPSELGERALSDRWMDWQQTMLPGPWINTFFSHYRTPEQYRDHDNNAAELTKVYSILDRHLEGRTFIAGDRLTIGDIPLGMSLYRYHTMDIERPSLPNIKAWYARLQEREAYRSTIMMTDYSSLKNTLIPGQRY